MICRLKGAISEKTYWLSKARREQFKKLYAFVDECGISLPEMSLRFVISNPDIHCVLMGARSIEEVEQNHPQVENVQYHHAGYDEVLGADEDKTQQPVQRATEKVGRNDPCPCGSGKKYKHCHGKLS